MVREEQIYADHVFFLLSDQILSGARSGSLLKADIVNAILGLASVITYDVLPLEKIKR